MDDMGIGYSLVNLSIRRGLLGDTCNFRSQRCMSRNVNDTVGEPSFCFLIEQYTVRKVTIKMYIFDGGRQCKCVPLARF